MADVRFECANCGQHLEADADMAGETIHCPQCTVELVIPQPEPSKAAAAPPSPPFPVPQPQPELEVRIKKPNLFWRRIAAVIVDLVFLEILIFAGISLTGTPLLGSLLAWMAFFGLWFTLHLKFGLSLGKLLVHVRTTRTEQSGEQSPLLLGRFALTWLPLLVMMLLAHDHAWRASGGTTAFVKVFLVLACIWYLCILVSLIVTKGRRGLHDMIVRSVTDFKTPTFLSVPRKVFASLAAVALVAEMAFIDFTADSADSSPSSVQSGTDILRYDRNARYDAQQIRAFYGDRVFEVSTSWQQPGGFLWLDTVTRGGKGSALMIANTTNIGLLISAWHVVQPSSWILGGYECLVRRSPKEDFVKAAVVARARNFDLALLVVTLKENWEARTVPTASIAEIIQGEPAVAIGNALGRGISVTDGLISMIEGDPGAQIIRTSAPVSPGNSGGPLFLQRGALLAGVITAQDRASGAQNVNYAIPAEYIWDPENWVFFINNPDEIAALLRKDHVEEGNI